MATLTKMEANDQRMVLRIWRTQTLVQYDTGNAPLLLVSLTADGLDPVAFGYAQLQALSFGPDRLATEKVALVAALPQAAAQPGRIVYLPLAVAQ